MPGPTTRPRPPRPLLPAGAAITAALVLGGCGGGAGDAVTPPPAPAAPATAPATAPAGSFGPPVAVRSFDGQPLVVTLLRVLDPVRGSGVAPPAAEGRRYVAAELRIADRGARPHAETPVDGTTVIDSRGVEWAAGTLDAVGPPFGSATIAPGAARTGWVTFEVPAAAPLRALRFRADGGFGGRVEWRLP